MPLDEDDALLASAFRKILNPGRYSYLYVSDHRLTIDDSFTSADGLTPEEFGAIQRSIMEV